MKRKSKISRSVYQKQVEKNKALLRDIRIITEPGVKSVLLRMKYRDRFKHDEDLERLLKTAAKKYFSDHPELMIDFKRPDRQRVKK
jgi:predicted amidophosphoribosyltransferase